jgi:hypothetical protein
MMEAKKRKPPFPEAFRINFRIELVFQEFVNNTVSAKIYFHQIGSFGKGLN